MEIIAGVDIGNATTEVALARFDKGEVDFLSNAIVPTTGIKGTAENIQGVLFSLRQVLEKVSLGLSDLDLVRINEAAPVIGDVAMETITETIITESTMIGHNPSTPGGIGLGIGKTIYIEDLESLRAEGLTQDNQFIVLILSKINFLEAATRINSAVQKGINITAAVAQRDDGVLINNRLDKKIPIVDEVMLLEKVPLAMKAAVEVAGQGNVVETLSNPYGIATVFGLSSEIGRAHV